MVKELYESGQYTKLVKFLLEAVCDVLKEECKEKGETEYLCSDFTVLVDSCATSGIISEHSHASLINLKEIHTKALSTVYFIPDHKISQMVKSNTWKYQSGSSKGEDLSRDDAAQALVICYDLLQEIQEARGDARFEPFLTNFVKAFKTCECA